MQNNEIPFSERPVGFREDETKINNNVSNRPPRAMLQLPDTDPDRDRLNKEDLKIAKETLFHKKMIKDFPRSTAYHADPNIPRQNYTPITFIPAKGATPDKEGCYGLMKVRGVFNTEQEAEQWCEKLIRDHDTINDIDVTNVGQYFPLMRNNEAYVAACREIDIRKKVVDETKTYLANKKMEEEKQKREINERRQKLLDKDHTEEKLEDDKDQIVYFIKLKHKRAEALDLIETCEEHMAKAKKVVESSDKEIEEVLEAHPEFKDEYLKRYQEAQAAVGVTPELDKLLRHMK